MAENVRYPPNLTLHKRPTNQQYFTNITGSGVQNLNKFVIKSLDMNGMLLPAVYLLHEEIIPIVSQ